MGIDIIIYALVAAVLIGRLWTVLGRRNESEPQRPNPFIKRMIAKVKGEDTSFADASAATAAAQRTEAMNLFQPIKVAPTSLLGGLEQVKTLDPAFDEKQVLQNLRQSFTNIIENFAKGDLSPVTKILGPKVLPNFQAAIDARKAAGQTMDYKILRVKDAETAAANIDGNVATMTVRFISEQQNCLRDASGQVIGGDPDVTEEVTDQWVFSRDTKATDPNWVLVDTHA